MIHRWATLSRLPGNPDPEKGISIRIVNTFNLGHPGNLMVAEAEPTGKAVRAIDRILAQADVSIMAVVGTGTKGTLGIGAKVFGALGRNAINVISVAQGSSEYNISLVIDDKDVDDAVRYIHQEFELGG